MDDIEEAWDEIKSVTEDRLYNQNDLSGQTMNRTGYDDLSIDKMNDEDWHSW